MRMTMNFIMEIVMNFITLIPVCCPNCLVFTSVVFINDYSYNKEYKIWLKYDSSIELLK